MNPAGVLDEPVAWSPVGGVPPDDRGVVVGGDQGVPVRAERHAFGRAIEYSPGKVVADDRTCELDRTCKLAIRRCGRRMAGLSGRPAGDWRPAMVAADLVISDHG